MGRRASVLQQPKIFKPKELESASQRLIKSSEIDSLIYLLPKVLSDCMSPDSVIPAEAGIQSFQSRGRGTGPRFLRGDGREKVITFGNCFNRQRHGLFLGGL